LSNIIHLSAAKRSCQGSGWETKRGSFGYGSVPLPTQDRRAYDRFPE